MSSTAERRFTRGLVEVRATAGESRTMRIGGYTAKFNKLSRNLGGFVERIDPAFFAKSEGDGWPEAMARYNHDDTDGTVIDLASRGGQGETHPLVTLRQRRAELYRRRVTF
ncbi:HK97 family phage prohead protease [Streptomyces sp.]|uniref:HK97 family phage prohead protease n=1 Tax=Streptomyces sp. TaxID=1931 RepID=UPI002F3E71DF